MIEVKNLWYIYQPMGVVALRDINLEIKDGEFVAIIGQNGSGKSTLVKHFNGLLKPTKGMVLIDGIDTRKCKTSELARKVGYVFQNPDHQIFAETVREEMEFGPKNLGFPEERIKRNVEEVAKRTGLYEYLDESPVSLSRGQRQVLAVASVLTMEPTILIVDEPTTGLDWRGSIAIMELIKKLNQEGKTIIIITHNMRIVSLYAKRTIVMCRGEILLDGPTDEVFLRTEELEKAFIRPPTNYLLALELSKYVKFKGFSVEDVLSGLVEHLKVRVG